MRVGSRKMTPQDDRLAALLLEMGFSARRVATLMETTDKTIATAAERGRDKPETFPPNQERKVKELLEYFKWLADGETRGYLVPLASYLNKQSEARS